MSYFARIQALNAMAAAIRTETMKLETSVPKPGTHSHDTLARKIEDWQQSITVAERNIKSASHFNHMVHRKARFGPGSYAAGQRLRSKEANLAQVREAVFDVAEAMTDLLARYFAGPNAGQRGMEGLKHAIKRLSQQSGDEVDFSLGMERASVEAQVRVMADSLPLGAQKPFNPGGIIDVFTLILAYFVLLKSLRQDKAA